MKRMLFTLGYRAQQAGERRPRRALGLALRLVGELLTEAATEASSAD